MAEELWHFIGGKRVKGTSGKFADVFWPMTGEVAARVPLASKAEVRAAVENAKSNHSMAVSTEQWNEWLLSLTAQLD